MLNTNIIASDITLLLSRKSIKKANMTLDFKNNHPIIFDQSIQLIKTLCYSYKSIQNNSEQCNLESKYKCNLSSNRR